MGQNLFYGTSGSDRIVGKNIKFMDFINAMGGDDLILTRGGDARVHAGAGNDTIIVGERGGPIARAEVFGGAGSDRVDLTNAGPSLVWVGTDIGVGHDTKPANRWDVDTIRFGTSRGQIANLEGVAEGQTIVLNNVWENRHHIVVPGTIFDLELENLKFARWGADDWYLKRAVWEAEGGTEIRINFAAPNVRMPDGNTVYDRLPDWEDSPVWTQPYAWHFGRPGEEELGGESPWFGLLV